MGNLVDTFIITPKKQWERLLYVETNSGTLASHAERVNENETLFSNI